MDEKKVETLLLVTEAMTTELDDYLLGDGLYRQLMVKTPLGTQQPKMTLSGLLENLDRLAWMDDQLTREQRQRVKAARAQVDTARRSFAAQWRSFLRRELKALLGSWRWYLDDARRDASARENYAGEVYHRTRIDLILRELAGDPAIGEEREELANLDARLRSMWQAGEFVGPRDQEGRFGPERAWWLYGRPRG